MEEGCSDCLIIMFNDMSIGDDATVDITYKHYKHFIPYCSKELADLAASIMITASLHNYTAVVNNT